MKNKVYIIWGCGGHGREVNYLCDQIGYSVLGFLDERIEMKGRIIDGKPVLGDLKDIDHIRKDVKIICAGVGDPLLRKKFVLKTLESGFNIAESIIHPSVFISKTNKIGLGSVICEGAIITTGVTIGDFVIINRGSNISHDDFINDYSTIGPGVNIAGNVKIGKGVYIGIGASIIEKVNIGCWSFVGGGAFVKGDVPPYCLYAGVPAVFKKMINEEKR